jgi:hypothetical protein
MAFSSETEGETAEDRRTSPSAASRVSVRTEALNSGPGQTGDVTRFVCPGWSP